MSGNKVSIIIPAYNAEKFLSSALDSVLAQTYQNFEIIIVNDGSTDQTEKIVKNYQQRYPGRIKYFSQQNQGQGAARNMAMKNAGGDYFAFLDADDLWLPEKLEKQLKKLKETGAGLCFTDAEIFGEGESATERFSQIVSFQQSNFLESLIKTNFIVNSSVLMRRVVSEKIGFQKEARVYQNIEDYDYWLRAVLRGFKFVYLPEVLVRYRTHSVQSSARDPAQGLRGLLVMYGNLIFSSEVIAAGKVFKVIEMFLKHTKTLVLLGLKSALKKTLFYRWLLVFREYKDYKRWKQYIDPDNPSPPPYFKRKQILKQARLLRAYTLVETGTYQGDTPYFLQPFFKEIYTIELDLGLYQRAKVRLAQFKNIKVFQGDSGEVLSAIIGHLREPVVFWLDAYYSGEGTARSEKGDTPVETELRLILSSSLQKYIILIDDAYLFGFHSAYPTLEKIEKLVKNLKPDLDFWVRDQIIFIGKK